MPDPGWLEVVVALAVLVGAAVQSATGFGFALIAGPALFAVLGHRSSIRSKLGFSPAYHVNTE